MKLPQMLMAELRRLLATPMARLALLALSVVPLLYGGVYLWANQDPYAKLDELPAAIVVLDRGSGTGEDYENLGNEIANEVIDDASFLWSRVSAAEAEAGVEDGTYDFALTFPASFTEDILSVSTDDPHQAAITLTTNDANSYLATTIGTQAVARIKASVIEKVGKEAASRLLTALQDVRSGMVDAADGAGKLEDSLAQAKDGTARLMDGAQQLRDGAQQLDSGAGQLASGLTTMRDQTAALPSQTQQLASGAQQVADGNAQIAALGAEVAGVTSNLAAGVNGARSDIVARLEAAGLDADQIAQVMGPLDQLGSDIQSGNARVQHANAQLQQLSSGAQQVADGASRLASATPALTAGIAQVSDGANQLSAGTGRLADGTVSLVNGVDELQDGVDRLHDGAAELHTGLEDGYGQIPLASESLVADQAGTIAAPVDVDSDAQTSAGTYGAGLAPFFISLAAWIGMYALMLIIKPLSRRAVTALRQPFRVTMASWLAPGLFGVAQMVALFGVVAAWLGFSIAEPWGMVGMMALTSLTFAAIIVALNVWLGSVGQFIGLVLMVLQLVTAGGTFPWQTLPEPLAALHHVLPMSYAVSGLRQLMYGGSMSAAAWDALVLVGFLVGALVLIFIGVAQQMDHRTLKDLQPSLIG